VPKLRDLEGTIADFLADIESAGSERSAKTYASALSRFCLFLDEKGRRARRLPRRKKGATAADLEAEPLVLPGVTEITVQDAVDFGRWLDAYMVREHGRSPSQAMLFTYTSAVRSFYAYLHREALHPDLDLEALRERLRKLRGKREKRLPRVPTDSVVEGLCRAAQARPVSPDANAELIRLRDIALLESLRSSGMRVSEAVALRREAISFEERSAVVQGKGAKDRVVFFSDEALAALRVYWQRRGDERLTRHVGSLPAFARHDDGATGKVIPLATQGVRRVVEELRKLAGADWPVTPHRLRAWFATHMLDGEGVNLAEVQDLLGHESANTTRIYTKVRARRLQDAHERVFPRQGGLADEEATS
jgi:integrase/recombinase XerC